MTPNKQSGYPRLAVCRCGERIVPTMGTPGACWEHEATFFNGCRDGGRPEAVKVLDQGFVPRRKRRKKK